MMIDTLTNKYTFPDAQGIVISGDIHGDFNLLVNKICVQYQMRDTLVIVAGDCGFGFENIGYYNNIVKRNTKRMNECNNWIVFIRGNHDNPAYFDGKSFMYNRFMAVPDYAILNACGHTILSVGGAISIDRKYRQDAWEQYKLKHRIQKSDDLFAKNYYWSNENPTIQFSILERISAECVIDTVVTHTAPSFCELQNKNGLCCYAYDDNSLINDVTEERAIMDKIYNMLKHQKHPINHWCYGHFHQSWHASIKGTLFKMLDIMELYEIR